MKIAVFVAVSLCVAAVAAADPQRLAALPFERGSSQIEVEPAQLAKIVRWAQEHPDGAIVLDGHADREGRSPDNVRLSLARAQAVRDELVEAGVNPDQIMIGAYGEAGAKRYVVIWGITAPP